ncbi:hypothetical protein RF11_00788 [Thelohanellus kitauei]|uniref:Uncharacterized protein n=1 Tax=Thelohanellus kitauei TaxID=669202 RepID=A0A0C2NC45_THEKT|nr:hypothetical protein RF11_00788 [Thelohanellus kitauei]
MVSLRTFIRVSISFIRVGLGVINTLRTHFQSGYLEWIPPEEMMKVMVRRFEPKKPFFVQKFVFHDRKLLGPENLEYNLFSLRYKNRTDCQAVEAECCNCKRIGHNSAFSLKRRIVSIENIKKPKSESVENGNDKQILNDNSHNIYLRVI